MAKLGVRVAPLEKKKKEMKEREVKGEEKKREIKQKKSVRKAQLNEVQEEAQPTDIHLEKQEDGGGLLSAYGSHDDHDLEHDGQTSPHDNGNASDASHEAAEESDSSEDEVASRNTVGDVPLMWYRDEEHIGYDIKGKKIRKKQRQDNLEKLLASADDTENWRKIYDEYNDEEVELTKEEVKLVSRLLQGKTPHADLDPYEPYVDWFKWEDAKHPLSNAPEPKRRFIPSKWEAKKIIKYVRAIREGRIKFDKPKEEPRFYNLWADDSASSQKTRGLSYIPPPKTKLPGHEESYNPSLEYIPTEEEIDAYQLMYEEDRPKLIPKRYESLRSVPAYEKALKEAMERCLDVYMCPRVHKRRLNIDPDAIKPKMPNPKDLEPYPVLCQLEFKGHKGAVVSISLDTSGQWIASGSSDGTARIWDLETGRCIRVWDFGEAVTRVVWNPVKQLPLLAVTVGADVLILDTGVGNEEEKSKCNEVLRVKTPTAPDDNGNNTTSIVNWLQDEKHGGVRISHSKTISSVEWHRKGDYFCTIVPADESRALLMHQLSKKVTQRFPFKLRGIPVCSAFHPCRSLFFIATKKYVRVYDLLKHKLVKKLTPGVQEVSSIAIHPGGDNVIVGSRDGKLCWFDMDLSSQPFRSLKSHTKDITNVAFHSSYPLFASSSDDCTSYVCHGMVYQDLNKNPYIVPLKFLRGHSSCNGRGVLDCKFHPSKPWLLTAGSDSVIRLFCHL